MDCGDKLEVREASTRRGVVGYEDARLLDVNNKPVTKRRGTDPGEAAVCEAGTVDVPQTLGSAVQLLLYFSEWCGGESETAYQLQSVGAIVLNVVHDAPVHHPL